MRGVSALEDKDKKIHLLSARIVELENQNRIMKSLLKDHFAKKKIKLSDFGIEESAFFPSIQGDKFYSSRRWRELRFKVLKDVAHPSCSLCKKDLKSLGEEIHVDHIRPRIIFPELALDIKNLQILCKDCNLGKGTKIFRSQRKTILRKAKLY